MRLATISVLAIVVAACGSINPPSPSPTITARPSQVLSSATFSAPQLTCGDLNTPPPYDALKSVPGISVHVIDTAHFELTNLTDRDLYFAVFHWTTDDNLVCGRGVTSYDGMGGPVPAGSTVEGLGGSTPEVPVTVAIWDKPCGEGCTDPPIGEFVVRISAVEPEPTPL
jgi:hypothetical protein